MPPLSKKLLPFSIATLLAFTGTVGTIVPAHANAPGMSYEVATENVDGPEDLPYKAIEEVRVEAKERGFTAEETELAVQIQTIINNSQAPGESNTYQGGSLGRYKTQNFASVAGFSAARAGDCVLAVADAASIAVPGANIWKWVKFAGGAISFVDVVTTYLESARDKAAEKILAKEIGEEAAKTFNKILAVESVYSACFAEE